MGEKVKVVSPEEVQTLARKFHQISRLENSTPWLDALSSRLTGQWFPSTVLPRRSFAPKAEATSPASFHRVVPRLQSEAI